MKKLTMRAGLVLVVMSGLMLEIAPMAHADDRSAAVAIGSIFGRLLVIGVLVFVITFFLKRHRAKKEAAKKAESSEGGDPT